MARKERWFFTKEELANSPSRRCGISAEKEQYYRQQSATLIQEIGQKLKVTQLAINTAIVYLHRFYTFHSFTKFNRNAISTCSIFLAAKVEEQHRKLEHVIRISQMTIHRENVDLRPEYIQNLASELVYHENLMLRTLGFDLSIQHPHTSVVNCCQLLRADKDFAQASYMMATNILHLTSLCLQFKPTVVACICIYFVAKWAGLELARSAEGKDWWEYVDPTVNRDILESMTEEMIKTFKTSPSRLRKIIAIGQQSSLNKKQNSPYKLDDRLAQHDLKNEKSRLIESTPSAKHSSKEHPKPHLPLFSNVKLNSAPVFPVKKESLTKSQHEHFSKVIGNNSVNSLMNSTATAQSMSHDSLPSASHQSKSLNSRDEDTSKMKDVTIGNNSVEKMKPHLSVISSSNPLSTNANCHFTESFFESQAMFSSDSNEFSDYSLSKKELPDLKMEFSDNEDSNQANNNINLTSTFMINDSNDSKPFSSAFPNNKLNNNGTMNLFDFNNKFGNNNEVNQTTSLLPNSFSNILKEPYTGLPSNIQQSDFTNVGFNRKTSDIQNLNDKTSLSLSNNKQIASNNMLQSSLNEPTRISSFMEAQTSASTSFNSIINSLTDAMPESSALLSISKPELTNVKIESASTSLNLGESTTDPLSTYSNSDDTSSHYSKKHHKEKHKHKDKHKDKHKEKHKHKHKNKDKDKHREKYSVEQIEQPNFKVSHNSAIDQPDQPARIRLKIRKSDMTEQSSDTGTPDKSKLKSNDRLEPNPAPLKLKISLNANKNVLASNSLDSIMNDTSRPSTNKKRKH